ncbi:hypothetical protein [Massilia consociata]|uniref:Uncharacterized protein n=1 Tax=Massilia consociata TaxID=760117 RepID=A0ABV6FAD5_9BURK
MKPIPTETATDVGSVGKWIGAAAAGALMMYLLDPERGATRRRRALSTLREAGARTGASASHALHSAAGSIGAVKDSAADALARGASRLHATTAPMVERLQDSARQARDRTEYAAQRTMDRLDSGSGRGMERAISDTGRAPAPRHDSYRDSHRDSHHNRYESDRRYDARYQEPSRLSQFLHGLGDSVSGPRGSNTALVGGGLIGMLGLVRRSPLGLLAGLAGLALLARSSGRTQGLGGLLRGTSTWTGAGYSNKLATDVEDVPFTPAAEQQGSRYLH